jgi:glycosyltransferase involved in cell wall biosynthesis
VPVKDQVTLLRAFAQLRREHGGACLEIVGSGPLAASLRDLAAGLGLDGSVRFRGEVDHAQLPSVYRGAGACVVSSRHEAQCMVALEAAACGVPLAGTRVGVMPEVTAALAPIGNAAALAEAIGAALSSQVVVPYSRVQAEYGLEVCTNRFRALYSAS